MLTDVRHSWAVHLTMSAIWFHIEFRLTLIFRQKNKLFQVIVLFKIVANTMVTLIQAPTPSHSRLSTN